jgi:hypothetical protein
MRAYRCRECQRRFYVPGSVDKKIMAERQWIKDSEKTETKAQPRRKI